MTTMENTLSTVGTAKKKDTCKGESKEEVDELVIGVSSVVNLAATTSVGGLHSDNVPTRSFI